MKYEAGRMLPSIQVLGIVAMFVALVSAEAYDWKELSGLSVRMQTFAMEKNEFKFMDALRQVVEKVGKGENKFVAWDSKNWQLKYGVASYIHGYVDVLRVNPYWGSIATSAHVLHTEDLQMDGMAYTRSALNHKAGTSGFSMLRNNVESKPGFTKIYTLGDVNPLDEEQVETPETCEVLERTWDEIYRKSMRVEDGLVILSSEMYCPTYLLSKVTKYTVLETTPIRHEDGLVVDYVVEGRKIKKSKEQVFRESPEQ